MCDQRVEFRQDDIDVITAVPRGLNVIKNFVKGDSAVRKLIELEEDILAQCGNGSNQNRINSKKPETQLKPSPCDSAAAGGEDDRYDPCSNLCGSKKTSITLEELTPPRKINAAYKHAILLDEETFVGRAFPVKFRIQRHKGQCPECSNESPLFSTTTENTNVVLLTNCCDVMVWPSQKVEQMNKVPVTLITGTSQLTEYVLEEPTIM